MDEIRASVISACKHFKKKLKRKCSSFCFDCNYIKTRVLTSVGTKFSGRRIPQRGSSADDSTQRKVKVSLSHQVHLKGIMNVPLTAYTVAACHSLICSITVPSVSYAFIYLWQPTTDWFFYFLPQGIRPRNARSGRGVRVKHVASFPVCANH